MLVRCNRNYPTDEQLTILGEGFRQQQRFQITREADYIVLGIAFFRRSSVYGTGVYVSIEDDDGALISAPLLLFDIIDDRPSHYWQARVWDDGTFAWWPAIFFEDYFHEELSDGVADVRRRWAVTRSELRAEANL